MSLNSLPLPSQARAPRALLKINDTVIRKIDYLEYIENNYYQPDSFHVQLPLYNLDDAIQIEYWLSQPAIMVDILTGFPDDPNNYGIGDLESLVLGGINDINIRIFDNGGGFAEFDGFDLSKKFIDNKIIEKYPNLTSSQIATKLAITRGLKPVVTGTKTPAGFYYTQDYVQLGNAVTEWDLLTYLAQREGFQVFVRGQSLYFQPRPVQSSDPYIYKAVTLENGQLASFNGTKLVLSRNLNYAKDIFVTVRSWSAKAGRVEVTAHATPNKHTVLAVAAQPIGEAQRFDYFIPGLNKAQAQARAQALVQDISSHERLLETCGPADNLMRKDTVIQLQGVSVSADQNYYPDTITRRMSGQEGSYTMEVRAKNHSPQSTVII